jgi:hypothetical protein
MPQTLLGIGMSGLRALPLFVQHSATIVNTDFAISWKLCLLKPKKLPGRVKRVGTRVSGLALTKQM